MFIPALKSYSCFVSLLRSQMFVAVGGGGGCRASVLISVKSSRGRVLGSGILLPFQVWIGIERKVEGIDRLQEIGGKGQALICGG